MHYKPIGACIYCGEAKEVLSKEHIVAYGLGGVEVLPRASCSRCRDLTSQFEGKVARDMFGDLRIRENYPSRRKEKRPTELPQKYFGSDGQPRLAKILASKAPLHYPTITFSQAPGYCSGTPPRGGNPEMQVSGQVDAASLEEAMNVLGADGISLSLNYDWTAYCQTLAKTAHSLVCAQVGIRGWQPLLPPLIRLDDSCFGHYIGSAAGHPEGAAEHAVCLSWEVVGGDHALVAYLQHLGRLKIPMCKIVVGVITDQPTLFEEASRRGHNEPMKRMWAAEKVRAAGLWPEGLPIAVSAPVSRV